MVRSKVFGKLGEDSAHKTCVHLLDQLRDGASDRAWEQFVRRYKPLLFHWARRLGLQFQDAADLVQDVFLVLVRKLPNFEYQPGRSFRGWMRAILINRWRDLRLRRATEGLTATLEPVAPPDAGVFEEREHCLHVLGRALRLMAADFEPATWQAFWETVVCGRASTDVAADVGLSIDAVYMAKSRVLSRLRRDLKDLAA